MHVLCDLKQLGGVELMTIQFEHIFQKVLPVLENKLAEFNYLQYDGISTEDIWDYCIQKKWKKKSVDQMHLYEIVQTIFSLKVSDVMNYFQVQEMQQTTDWFASINQEELNELLNLNKNEENPQEEN